jgi:hypothetical protein
VSPRAVRLVVVAVCASGIAGMVVGSIADDTMVTLTFGLVTAAAVACLMVATAVSGGVPVDDDEVTGARVEALVAALVAGGAEEHAVRELVREAVALGRSRQGRSQPGRGHPGKPAEKAGAEVHGGRTPRPGDRTVT